MKRVTTKKSPTRSARAASLVRMRVGLLILAGGVLALALLLFRLGAGQPQQSQRSAAGADPALEDLRVEGQATSHSSSEAGVGQGTPWEATSDDSRPVPAGQVAPWVVQPPKPNPVTQTPPRPVPPPDPQTSKPPLENPGGVNGTRPPRLPQ